MALVKWVGELANFRGRTDQWAEDDDRSKESMEASATWLPSADILEKDGEVVITAEIPGTDENDIQLEVKDRTLILRGKREFEEQTNRDDYTQVERSYGPFLRSFALLSSADIENIRAVHDRGLLKITIPKAPESAPKRIAIEATGK